MTLALLFWIVFVVSIVISISRNYTDRVFIINNLVYWILFGILGYAVFGGFK